MEIARDCAKVFDVNLTRQREEIAETMDRKVSDLRRSHEVVAGDAILTPSNGVLQGRNPVSICVKDNTP